MAASNTCRSDPLSDSETLYEENISSFSQKPKERTATDSWKKPRWDVEDVIKRGVIDTRA